MAALELEFNDNVVTALTDALTALFNAAFLQTIEFNFVGDNGRWDWPNKVNNAIVNGYIEKLAVDGTAYFKGSPSDFYQLKCVVNLYVTHTPDDIKLGVDTITLYEVSNYKSGWSQTYTYTPESLRAARDQYGTDLASLLDHTQSIGSFDVGLKDAFIRKYFEYLTDAGTACRHNATAGYALQRSNRD